MAHDQGMMPFELKTPDPKGTFGKMIQAAVALGWVDYRIPLTILCEFVDTLDVSFDEWLTNFVNDELDMG